MCADDEGASCEASFSFVDFLWLTITSEVIEVSKGNFVYQINLKNGTRAFVVANASVDEPRVWALAVAAGLGEIVDVKKIGPVMATMLDSQIIPDQNFEQAVRTCRD